MTNFTLKIQAGKICLQSERVNGQGNSCTCADFISQRKAKDPEFLCKHLIAALNGNGNHQKIGPMVEMEDHHNEPKGPLGVYKAISGVQMALAKLGIEKLQENKFDNYKFQWHR